MKLIYTPEDGIQQTWEFDPRRLMNVELIAIERHTGLKGLTSFGEALAAGSAVALTAVVWVLRKRSEPTLRIEEVTFAIGDLSFENDEAEPPDPKSEPEPDAGGSSELSPSS